MYKVKLTPSKFGEFLVIAPAAGATGPDVGDDGYSTRKLAREAAAAWNEGQDTIHSIPERIHASVVRIGSKVSRTFTPKRYRVMARCLRKDSSYQKWEETSESQAAGGHTTRAAARAEVVRQKQYDERHAITDWKYKIVEEVVSTPVDYKSASCTFPTCNCKDSQDCEAANA